MNKIDEYESLDTFEVNGDRCFSVINKYDLPTDELVKKIKGTKVKIDGVEYFIWGVETFAKMKQRKGDPIALAVKMFNSDVYLKWEKIGLLEGFNSRQANLLADNLEELARHLISMGENSNINTIIFPIYRRIFSDLAERDLLNLLPTPKYVYINLEIYLRRINYLNLLNDVDVNVDVEYEVSKVFSNLIIKQVMGDYE